MGPPPPFLPQWFCRLQCNSIGDKRPGVMPYRALLASALLLAACTTTQGVTDRLGERYTGRHVDQFFITYGPPVSEYALSSGDKFYTWRSGVNSVTLPGSSNFSGSVSKYGKIQGQLKLHATDDDSDYLGDSLFAGC
jgi:hypothetical protein